MTVTSNSEKLLPARRILVMRYRFLGDTILIVPALRNLKKAYPDAKIDVLVGPGSGAVLEGCPYVDELISFDTTRFHKYENSPGKPRNLLSYALELRSRQYDLVFAFKRSWSSGLLAWLTGARYRVGYNTEGRRLFLTHPVEWDQSVHEVESTLQLLEAAHVPVTDRKLEAWISPQEERQIQDRVEQLEKPGPHVLIHAAAAHPDKMMPLATWSQIIRSLSEATNAKFYFSGADKDRELYRQLEEISGVSAVNLAGSLSIRLSMALYEKMDLAVCVDSGPAHLAAATGTPVVSIFGPTDPNRWRPWGEKHVAVYDRSLACLPCNYNKTCDDLRPCLTDLQPELVTSSCFELLEINKMSGSGR